MASSQSADPGMTQPRRRQGSVRRADNPFGLWGPTARLPIPTDRLAGDAAADVVVVGAGFTGLSAALHLAESGARVRVLEAGEIGCGAAGRSSGFVNPGLWAPPASVILAFGAERGERLLSLLGSAPATVYDLVERLEIDCELSRSGTLQCASDLRSLGELHARSLEWSSRGVPQALVSEDDTAALVGSRAYLGAIVNKSGGTLNPLSYIRGLAAAAAAAGAIINTQSPVSGSERGLSRWNVRTAGGSIQAEWILLATDAYSSGPWRSIRQEQVLLPYFNVATARLPTELARSVLPARLGLVDTCRVMNAVRFDASGRLIVGSLGALRRGGAAVHRAWARRFLNRLFPSLDRVEFEHENWGQIGLTQNHVPRFHQLDRQVLSVSGYNGRGIATGTLFGKLLARRIATPDADEEFPIPPSPVEKRRLNGVRRWAYEFGALGFHAVSAYRPL